MKNFKNRVAYFEIENAINQISDFTDKVKTVRIISNWASEQLGYDIHETEAYARSHIANIVRENEVAKMLKRIENDLLTNNIDTNSELIVESTNNLLKNVSEKLRHARN